MMTSEDKQEIKELISQSMSGLHARTESKFDMIDLKLETIIMQTTKHNQRMTKIEDSAVESNKQIDNLEKENIRHVTDCPYNKNIRTLEDDQLSQKTIKKWVTQTIVLTVSIVSIFWMAFLFVKEIV